jgi:Ca-activated chloride channel family protein
VDVIFWWMGIVWLGAIALVVVILRRRRSRSTNRAESDVPIAHSDRLTALPGYRRAFSRYRRLMIGLATSLVVVLVASVALSMRFATLALERTDQHNRDIVLCLDVSGSMIDYDARVLDVFSELAEQFDGERLSLVIFNASAVTYFPLTSDLDYITTQLNRLGDEFESGELEFYNGTLVGDGSSLVGDGLASCAVRFDSPDEDRSRSIIFVTDNLVAGDPVFTLPEAGALAQERGVRVYGINPGDSTAKSYLDYLAVEFQNVVEATGGRYFALDNPDAIASIVEEISAEQALVRTGPMEVVRDERPELAAIIAIIALFALFGFAWRLRR